MKAPAALTLVENGDYPSKIDTWVKARRKGPVLVPPATPEPQPALLALLPHALAAG